MNNLNIHDLYKSIDTKNENKKRTFEQVLEKAHSKIKLAAKHDHYACFYQVPEFILGIPLYNITECIEYVVSALKDNGFLIKFIYPNTIYVSWDPRDINRSEFDTRRIEHKTEEQIDQFLLKHSPTPQNNRNIHLRQETRETRDWQKPPSQWSKPEWTSPQKPWQQKNGKFSLNLDDI